MTSRSTNRRTFNAALRGLALASLMTFSFPDARAATAVLPLHIDDFGIATVELTLDGTREQFVLDTGSQDGLHLPERMMASIPGVTKTGKTVRSIDLAGNTQDAAQLLIPVIRLGDLTLSDVPGVELKPWGLSIGTDTPPGADLPVVGLGFFKGYWVTIDYTRHRLSVSDQPPRPEEGWLAWPCAFQDEGLVITLTDGERDYAFALDTGATASLVKAESLPDGARLQTLQEVSDFPGSGPVPDGEEDNSDDLRVRPVRLAGLEDAPVLYALILKNLPEDFRADGLLGRDFFEAFAVQFNTTEQRLFLKPARQDTSR